MFCKLINVKNKNILSYIIVLKILKKSLTENDVVFTFTIATANEAGMNEKAIVTTTATLKASRS